MSGEEGERGVERGNRVENWEREKRGEALEGSKVECFSGYTCQRSEQGLSTRFVTSVYFPVMFTDYGR